MTPTNAPRARRRTARTIVVAAAVASLVAGCGGDDTADDDATRAWCDAAREVRDALARAESGSEADVLAAEEALTALGTLEPPAEIADTVEVALQGPPQIGDYPDEDDYADALATYSEASDRADAFLADTCGIAG